MIRPRNLTTNERTRHILEDLEAVREATGITTWRRLFELVCEQLLRRDPNRFHELVDHSDFISNRGNCSFARDPSELRSASLIGDGLYAEINMSANNMRDQIRRLLAAFEIPMERLQLFLRQDSDAGREADEG